jgi:predicted nucleic acid-binding protein
VTNYLLDTNVISEITRRSPNNGVLKFLENHNNFYVSVITIHELLYGINLLPEGDRKRKLSSIIDEFLKCFKKNILIVDENIAKISSSLRVNHKNLGLSLNLADSIIAATAKSSNSVVVTRNEKDFKNVEVGVLNPWI